MVCANWFCHVSFEAYRIFPLQVKLPSEDSNDEGNADQGVTIGKTNVDDNEQVLGGAKNQSLGCLILLTDAVHNFLSGLFVGPTFVDSISHAIRIAVNG